MGSIRDDPSWAARVPEHSRSVAWQTIDGETVLLHVNGKELLGLNAVAGRVWELSDGANSIEGIALKLTEEFDVAAETARADVVRFVDELIALRALTLRPD